MLAVTSSSNTPKVLWTPSGPESGHQYRFPHCGANQTLRGSPSVRPDKPGLTAAARVLPPAKTNRRAEVKLDLQNETTDQDDLVVSTANTQGFTAMTQGAHPTVRIVEVGPRDGLQNIRDAIPTATKLELIRRLEETGLRTIELTSVVSPRAIPQLADCREVLRSPAVTRLFSSSGLRLPVLVPNVKGLEIAVQHGVKEIAVFLSATEGFSKANINCTVEQGIERARQVASLALKSGVSVRG